MKEPLPRQGHARVVQDRDLRVLGGNGEKELQSHNQILELLSIIHFPLIHQPTAYRTGPLVQTLVTAGVDWP